jgi:hypothetical protein
MFASLRNKCSNYRTSSLRFDIEKNIIIEAFDRFASISMPLKGHGNEADFLICYLVLIFSDFAADHGLINYIERNLSKSLSSKKFFTCKGTLRQVFITVYRLELHFNHNTCRKVPLHVKIF